MSKTDRHEPAPSTLAQLQRIAAEVRRGQEATTEDGSMPGLDCLGSAERLGQALMNAGFSPRGCFGQVIVGGQVLASDHYWVECEGYWLDIAADQFNAHQQEQVFPPVLIGRPEHLPSHRLEYYCEE